MDGEHPGASGTAAEMDTGHIPQSSIQWAHHCPALCRQGRPNFLRQLSSCQLPAPLQHGGGSRHPTIGTKREPRHAPIRAVWSALRGSKAGRVVFIGGGPNCRTWSILRHIPKPGAPTPVRGRTRETLWGLPHLDQAAQAQLDEDSTLILRQMYITSLARASRSAVSLPGPKSFLEHPEDPVVSSSLPKAKECWITEEGQLWMEENSLTAISFDQCRLGQLVKKATTLATDLPLKDWDQMRCTHRSHVGTNESSTLSRYPWDMMAGLAKAIAGSLAAPGHIWIPHNSRKTLRNHLREGGRTPLGAFLPGENGDPIREAVPPRHTRAQSPEARVPRSPASTGTPTMRQTP